MSILTRTLFDITTKLDNKIQSNTENKFIIKQPQPLNQKLPYIKEATKNATSHMRSGRLNNSMDVHIDQSSFHPNKEDLHNNSFDMSGRLYGSVTRTSGMNYAKRNIFTKQILSMHKDKDIFSSIIL